MSQKRKSRDEHDVLDEAVQFFTEADGAIRVRGNVPLALSLETLENVSKTKGLSPLHISQLVNCIVTRNYSDTLTAKVVKKLIPSTVVPEKTVLQLVSWMCTNKPSVTIQVLLVRWILLIYDYMDRHVDVHKLYGFLFYFLENQALAHLVSQLLYFMTRREDVRMFRIRRILELQKKIGVQPYLTGLLSLYKLYYPSLVFVSLPKTHKYFFKPLDRKWSVVIQEVQSHNKAIPVEPYLRTDRIHTGKIVTKNKRRPYTNIPISQPMPSPDLPKKASDVSERMKSVPFVQIDNFKDMLTHIEKIEFPSQIGAILNNQLLKHLLCFSSDKVTAARLQYWLYDTLCEEFLYNDSRDYEQNDALLKLLVSFTDFCQEGVPVVDNFLMKYLVFWNGNDHKSHILRLLARYRLHPFGKLNDILLEPLRKLFFSSAVYFKCQVLLALTELLRNYAAYEWPRYIDIFEIQKKKELTGESKYCRSAIFVEEVEKFEPVKVVEELIAYISRLCVLSLQVENNNSLLQHCVLLFLEMVSSLHQLYGVPFVMLSTPEMFYRLTFTENALSLNRVCSILYNYKMAFDSLKEQRKLKKLDAVENDGTDTIPFCNSLLMDMSAAIWRSRPFHKIAPNNPFFNFDPRDIDERIPVKNDCFSIYLYQAMLGFAKKFLRLANIDSKGSGDLKENDPRKIRIHRQKYAAFLEQEHLSGISQFLSTFIKFRSGSLSMASSKMESLHE